MLHLIFVGEKHQIGGYRTEVQQLCYFKFRECFGFFFYGYPNNLATTDNSHKCRFTYNFKEKKDAFLRNTVNKHRVINFILTDLKKPQCNAYHSYDDADIDINKF